MSNISSTGETGRKSSISDTPVRLTEIDLKADVGIQVLSDKNNGGQLWLGIRDDITVDTADATDGFPIDPGQGLLMPVRNIRDIFVVSPSGLTQIARWMII